MNVNLFFKTATFALILLLNSFLLKAQQMEYTPYEELPSIQKILKPTYDESMPDWGKMLYQYPVNYFAINKAYSTWEKANPGVKTPLSRYFKLWRLQLESYVGSDGTIIMPDLAQLNTQLLKAQSPENQIQKAPAASNTSDWTFWGPKETYSLNQSGSSTAPKAAPRQANVYSIDITDSNPTVFYAGTETGFVNKTTDKGLSWNLSGKNYVFGGGITSIAVHPSNPDTSYVSAGGTVHRTLNGGNTWSRTGASFTADRLKIDYKNPSKLVAASSSGLWISTNRSSTWTNKVSSKCWDVEINPDNNNIIYGVTETPTHFTKIVQSVDGGSTFTTISSFPNNVPVVAGALLTMSAKNTNVLYIVVLSKNASVFFKLRD